MIPEPPSRVAWMVDAELNGGHTPEETLAYLAWVDDWQNQEMSVAGYNKVVSPATVPRGWLRRLFGR